MIYFLYYCERFYFYLQKFIAFRIINGIAIILMNLLPSNQHMSLKQLNVALFIFLFALGNVSIAQQGIYYEDTYAGDVSVCAWNSISLHEYPGRNTARVGKILFTEELEHLGREAFVRGENHNYIFVRTGDGNEGWVNENLLVKNGGVVTLVEDAPVYTKLKTSSSRTDKVFSAGEIVIMSDFKDGWVYLTSKEKKKSGWVKGYEAISAESSDIEIASLMADALALKDAGERKEALTKIGATRGFLSSDMALVVKKAIADQDRKQTRTLTEGEEFLTRTKTEDYQDYLGGEDIFIDDGISMGDSRGSNVQKVSDQQNGYNSYKVEKVVDMNTGLTVERVIETGTIQPVKAKKPKSIYYAYHKELPIGSKVLLAIPGNRGFVQLEIVAKLKSTNPNMIGLGTEVLKAVYGESEAKKVPYATIAYPRN